MQVNTITSAGLVLAGLLLAATNAHALVISPTSSGTIAHSLLSIGNSYAEVGDAGDRFAPQDVVGAGISQITGTIGPDFLPASLALGSAFNGGDLVDAFRFFFDGGDIRFDGTVLVGDNVLPLDLTLWPPTPITPVIPVNSGPGSISFLGLAAGNYILEAGFSTFDPPFTINLTNPTTGDAQTVSAPVPEPGSLALLGLGLSVLAALRRHRRGAATDPTAGAEALPAP